MKKSVKIVSAVIFTILICTMSIFSYASNAGEPYIVKLKTEQTSYKPGEIVEFVISVEDVQLEEGFAAVSAIINYDEDIFEEVTAKEIDEWGEPTLIDDMIQVTRKDLMNSRENQKVAIVSLKIREDAKATKTTISLSKFDVTDGNTTVRGEGTSLDIEVQGNKFFQDENGQNNNYMICIVVGVVAVMAVVVFVIMKKKKNK